MRATTKQQSTDMRWYLQACPACGGDLYEDRTDAGWVTCLLCGRSFRRQEIEASQGRLAPKAESPTEPAVKVAA